MIEKLLIAFIQGITEFIPVSSSLHIIIFSDLLGVEKNILNSVALHFGSLIALIAYFYNDKKALQSQIHILISGDSMALDDRLTARRFNK